MSTNEFAQKIEQSYCKYCSEPYNTKNPCDQHNPKCRIKMERNWKINGDKSSTDFEIW